MARLLLTSPSLELSVTGVGGKMSDQNARRSKALDANGAPGVADLRGTLLRYNHPALRSLVDAARAAIGALLSGGLSGRRIEAITGLVTSLSDEVLSHLYKEERLLLEPAARGESASLLLPFLIRVMDLEHATVERLASQLEDVTDGFVPGRSACPAERALYRELGELHGLVVEHLDLARDALFPALLDGAEAPRTLHVAAVA